MLTTLPPLVLGQRRDITSLSALASLVLKLRREEANRTGKMACAPIPSVTLYGTTQITTQVQVTATSLSTYLGEPAISLTTFVHTQCDAFGLKCSPQQTSSLVTVTPTMTSTVTEVVNTQTVLTSVVPQRTIYSPCPDGRQPTNTGGKAVETNKGGGDGDGDGGKESQEPVTQFTPPPAILTPSESTFQGVVSQTQNQVPSPPPPSTVIAFSSSVTQTQISSSQSARSNSNTEPALPYSSVTHPSSAYASISPIYSSSVYSSVASAGAQATTESSSPKGAVVAGAAVGGILGLCSLCCLLMWFRRRMGRDDDTGRSVGTVDYWERRFRELEADGGEEKIGSEGHFGNDGDPVEGEKSKKLRVSQGPVAFFDSWTNRCLYHSSHSTSGRRTCRLDQHPVSLPFRPSSPLNPVRSRLSGCHLRNRVKRSTSPGRDSALAHHPPDPFAQVGPAARAVSNPRSVVNHGRHPSSLLHIG